MENIKQFLLEQASKSTAQIDYVTDQDGNALDIEIINFPEALKFGEDKYFKAAVFIKYSNTDKFYCIEMYKEPISKTSMDEAIVRIKSNPKLYKNQ